MKLLFIKYNLKQIIQTKLIQRYKAFIHMLRKVQQGREGKKLESRKIYAMYDALKDLFFNKVLILYSMVVTCSKISPIPKTYFFVHNMLIINKIRQHYF